MSVCTPPCEQVPTNRARPPWAGSTVGHRRTGQSRAWYFSSRPPRRASLAPAYQPPTTQLLKCSKGQPNQPHLTLNLQPVLTKPRSSSPSRVASTRPRLAASPRSTASTSAFLSPSAQPTASASEGYAFPARRPSVYQPYQPTSNLRHAITLSSSSPQKPPPPDSAALKAARTGGGQAGEHGSLTANGRLNGRRHSLLLLQAAAQPGSPEAPRKVELRRGSSAQHELAVANAVARGTGPRTVGEEMRGMGMAAWRGVGNGGAGERWAGVRMKENGGWGQMTGGPEYGPIPPVPYKPKRSSPTHHQHQVHSYAGPGQYTFSRW